MLRQGRGFTCQSPPHEGSVPEQERLCLTLNTAYRIEIFGTMKRKPLQLRARTTTSGPQPALPMGNGGFLQALLGAGEIGKQQPVPTASPHTAHPPPARHEPVRPRSPCTAPGAAGTVAPARASGRSTGQEPPPCCSPGPAQRLVGHLPRHASPAGDTTGLTTRWSARRMKVCRRPC